MLEPEAKECLHTDLQALTRQKLEQKSAEVRDHVNRVALPENCAALPKTGPAKDPLKRKPPRHTVREGSPMEQFFRPMRAEEGGAAPALGDHALTPSERDGSAVTSRDVKTSYCMAVDEACAAAGLGCGSLHVLARVHAGWGKLPRLCREIILKVLLYSLMSY